MSRNDNLFKLRQSSTVNEILMKSSWSVNRFFRVASYVWFNSSWNFVWSGNCVAALGLSIWISVWKGWFLIAWKNRLRDINVCKSCSCKVIVFRTDIFSRIWVQNYLCWYSWKIRIVIINCYHISLLLYLES